MPDTLFTDAKYTDDECEFENLDESRHELEFCGRCGATLLAVGPTGDGLPPVVAASRLMPWRGGWRWVPLCGGCWDGRDGADTVVTGEGDEC